MRRLCLSLAAVCLLPGIAWGDGARKPVTVTPILSTATTASGQPIALPAGPVTVGVSRYVIEPGAKLPVHKHPSQRYAYVQAGNLTVYDVDTGQRFDYKPGDFIVEVLDQWHYGENTGAVPVELLVIDQTPAGTTVNTVTKP
ncbi:cupin domain-containing protein [Oleomonas cavernae]|uniref:Cupin domain-containing protein n=1 Tax=Oleomonas cavernae TaxID=2320859 RepID=A0A418WEZ6_9PROT|nr:cupin domain-containing protein [Oleomonas cavernae]RJF88499.1 cupin domain-containing protein [Oleomonas cavernae]